MMFDTLKELVGRFRLALNNWASENEGNENDGSFDDTTSFLKSEGVSANGLPLNNGVDVLGGTAGWTGPVGEANDMSLFNVGSSFNSNL